MSSPSSGNGQYPVNGAGRMSARLLPAALVAPNAELPTHIQRALGRSLDVVRLSDVKPEDVRWLWPGWLPCGKLTLLDGHPGTGKSLLSMEIAARITTGRPFIGGEPMEPANVLMVAVEDGLADTLVPRAEAAGADRDRIRVVRWVNDSRGDHVPALPQDVGLLREYVEEFGARYVVIDPLTAYFGANIDSYRDPDIRSALLPLARLAESTGAAVQVVRHLRKKEDLPAILAGSGSIGITAIARAAWLLAADPTDPSRRVLACYKSNIARRPQSLLFHFEDAGQCPRVAWNGHCTLEADELLRRRPVTRQARALDCAIEFLRTELTSGPRYKSELEEEARIAGISVRTLERAKEELRVVHFRESHRYLWRLPNVGSPVRQLS